MDISHDPRHQQTFIKEENILSTSMIHYSSSSDSDSNSASNIITENKTIHLSPITIPLSPISTPTSNSNKIKNVSDSSQPSIIEMNTEEFHMNHDFYNPQFIQNMSSALNLDFHKSTDKQSQYNSNLPIAIFNPNEFLQKEDNVQTLMKHLLNKIQIYEQKTEKLRKKPITMHEPLKHRMKNRKEMGNESNSCSIVTDIETEKEIRIKNERNDRKRKQKRFEKYEKQNRNRKRKNMSFSSVMDVEYKDMGNDIMSKSNDLKRRKYNSKNDEFSRRRRSRWDEKR